MLERQKLMLILILLAIVFVVNVVVYEHHLRKDFVKLLKCNEKIKREFQMLNYFLKYEYWKEPLADSLLKMNVNCIAVYGLGEVGNRVIERLEDSQIEVKYGIDCGKGADWCRNRKVYTLEEQLPQVDVILISVFDKDSEIRKKLQEKTNVKIMSLEEIVCWT